MIPSVTDEQTAISSRQLGPPEGGATCAAVLAGPLVHCQSSGSLMPTAMDSDLSKTAVTPDTANWHMSSDMSRPLSDKPDGTTPKDQVTTTYLPTPTYQQPIFIRGVSDTRSFLA
jgi:hypothetical protein